MTAYSWPPEVDEILGGDLTAALAYVTPAGGAVVTAVAPVGLRDPEAGTVTFTTSLGFGKKLDRIRRNPRVSLAYHARDHGFSSSRRYVLVQGDAKLTLHPDRAYLDEVLGPAAERFMGKRKSGLFWDRWLQEYYADRVPVTVSMERVVTWPDLRCEGEAEVTGAPRPPTDPPSQGPPAKGTAPRVDAERAARRIRRRKHAVVSFVDGDGYPFTVPVEVTGAEPAGMRVAASPGLLPPGGRRAGLLAHDYGPELVAIAARQETGWLEVADRTADHGLYAPHTDQGFRAPANKTVLLLANGLLAKRGLRRARKQAAKAAA
jgi:hypothetical protein